jgi:hypothetical protein
MGATDVATGVFLQFWAKMKVSGPLMGRGAAEKGHGAYPYCCLTAVWRMPHAKST